jgi:hypothetical protein
VRPSLFGSSATNNKGQVLRGLVAGFSRTLLLRRRRTVGRLLYFGGTAYREQVKLS